MPLLKRLKNKRNGIFHKLIVAVGQSSTFEIKYIDIDDQYNATAGATATTDDGEDDVYKTS